MTTFDGASEPPTSILLVLKSHRRKLRSGVACASLQPPSQYPVKLGILPRIEPPSLVGIQATDKKRESPHASLFL